jgi:hypothetical protein
MKSDIVERNTSIAEIDAEITNKWKWEWLDTEDEDKNKYGAFFGKLKIPGKDLDCRVCRTEISYKFEVQVHMKAGFGRSCEKAKLKHFKTLAGSACQKCHLKSNGLKQV